MPKRKSITGPRKRKRVSNETVPGPIPFGTQPAQSRTQGNQRASRSQRPRGSIVRETSVASDSDSSFDNANSRKRPRDDSDSEGSASDSDQDREEDDGGDAGDQRDELSRTKFAILKPRQRSVKQSIVKNKWDTLNEKAQERVQAIFDNLERPLIAEQGEERKRVEAQAALGQLMKMLHRRLPRMPFPKDTRDWHFDEEALMASNRALEASTTSQQHAIQLLKAEIRAQEASLDADEIELRELEKNAKKEARHRQRGLENRHPLLAELPTSTVTDSAAAIRLATGPSTSRYNPTETAKTHLDVSPDPLVLPLIKQLGNHLESLESNVAQVAGLDMFVTRAAAKLDALLKKRLDEDAYASLPAAL